MPVYNINSVLFLLLAGTVASAFGVRPEQIEAEKYHREWMNTWAKLVNEIQNNPSFSEAASKPIPQELPPVADIIFNCEVEESESVPTSVHRLRPSDVKVVAALGDSITAGIGVRAQILPAVVVPNKGESWSIGSDRQLEHTVVTLPNILKKFNPKLKGSSICNRGTTHPYMNWFNVAFGGAFASHMPGQAWNLIDRMRTDDSVDFFNDWKLITLLIGGNDLCRACQNENLRPDRYAQHIKEALDIMQDYIPRALVNLVVMADVSVVQHVNHSMWCGFIQRSLCPCALGENAEVTSRNAHQNYKKLKEIIDTGRYDKWDDFTVVLQTTLKNVYPDVLLRDVTLLQEYFSPDCFHPGQKGHHEMTMALWTSMLTPVGEKPYKLYPEDVLDYKCPSKEHPFIFTNQNSGIITSAGTTAKPRFPLAAAYAVTVLSTLSL